MADQQCSSDECAAAVNKLLRAAWVGALSRIVDEERAEKDTQRRLADDLHNEILLLNKLVEAEEPTVQLLLVRLVHPAHLSRGHSEWTVRACPASLSETLPENLLGPNAHARTLLS